MQLIDDHEGLVSCWLSGEPKGKHEIGLKALINFNTREIDLIEEDDKEKQYDNVLMSFSELKNLQTIIEERKGKK